MAFRRAALAAVLFCLASVGFADVTGTWSGSISGNTKCNNGTSSVPETLSLSLAILQSGNVVSGGIVATLPDDPCVAGSPLVSIGFPISGSISGSTISGTAFVPEAGPSPFTATVSGSSMTLTVTDVDGPFSGTLTQTSTQPPDLGFSGTYNGTYSQTLLQTGCPSLTSSGPFSAIVSQLGSVVTATATATASKDYSANGNCTVVTKDSSKTFSGTLNGNVVTAPNISNGGQVNGTITVTFSGNSLSGTVMKTDGSQTTFTGTRTSSGPPPIVSSFSVNPSPISAGEPSTLSWSTFNASSVSIDSGIGTQPVSGTVSVSPTQTTTYTLTATGRGGSTTATTTVSVSAAAPQIVVGSFPSGMLQATGTSGAVDSFTLTNTGAASGNVTLTQSRNFFTVSPASFTLNPGSSQIVEITATAQPSGTYDGSVNISPGGLSVPVHLLVAAPPTAPVVPQAAAPRADVAASAGQNPSGSISFTNSGSGTLTGIAVADVPWIVPQTGAITIAPGTTQNVSFNIDRSKRPDAASPAGGMAGRLFLVYLTNVASKGLVALGTTPTGNVSVTIVDVVKPGVAPGTPPPLQSGEVALPVLRSDRSIGAGDRLVFAGAQDSATTLWMQEVSGNAGHVSIQYLDANGAVIGTDSGNIPAFTAAVSGAVDGTRAIVMTNDSSAPARFAGYAIINDPTTNDGWVLTDPLHQWGSASGALIMPLVPATGSPTDIYMVNPSASSAAVTMQFVAAGRHRAVQQSAASPQASTIAPMSTMHTSASSSNGFVRISAGTPVSAVGRIILSASGASFGSSVPAVPESVSLAAGQGKPFTAVDDASPQSGSGDHRRPAQRIRRLAQHAGGRRRDRRLGQSAAISRIDRQRLGRHHGPGGIKAH